MRRPLSDTDKVMLRVSEFAARRRYMDAIKRKKAPREVEFWFQVGEAVDAMCDEACVRYERRRAEGGR